MKLWQYTLQACDIYRKLVAQTSLVAQISSLAHEVELQAFVCNIVMCDVMASSLQVCHCLRYGTLIRAFLCAFFSVTCSQSFQVSFRDRSLSNIDSYLTQTLVVKLTDSRNRRARGRFHFLCCTSHHSYDTTFDTDAHRDLMAPQRHTRRHLTDYEAYFRLSTISLNFIRLEEDKCRCCSLVNYWPYET